MKRFFRYFRSYSRNTRKEKVYVSEEFGTTILHFACANNIEDVIDTILDEGIDVNTIDNFGFTPLHLACERQSVKIVKALLNAGADTNISTYRGETPLYIACEKCNLDIVQLLLQYGADATLETERGDTPLSIACRFSRIDLVKLLLDNNAAQDEDRVNPVILRYACENGDLNMVELLLNRIPSLSVDKALHWACDCKNYYLIRTLLNRGADVNSVDVLGQTPLRIACNRRMFSAVRLFIEKNADVDIADITGVTPLRSLIWSFREISLVQWVDTIEVIKLLIDNFADLTPLSKRKDDRLVSMLMQNSDARVRARVALHVQDIDELKKSLREYYNQYDPEYNDPIKMDLSNLSRLKGNLNKLEQMRCFAKELKKSLDYMRLKKKLSKMIKSGDISKDVILNIKYILNEVNKFNEDVNELCNAKVVESILLPVVRMRKECKRLK